MHLQYVIFLVVSYVAISSSPNYISERGCPTNMYLHDLSPLPPSISPSLDLSPSLSNTPKPYFLYTFTGRENFKFCISDMVDHKLSNLGELVNPTSD